MEQNKATNKDKNKLEEKLCLIKAEKSKMDEQIDVLKKESGTSN